MHLTKEDQYRRVIREHLDTAVAITWLFSEDAGWNTGKMLFVDGSLSFVRSVDR